MFHSHLKLPFLLLLVLGILSFSSRFVEILCVLKMLTLHLEWMILYDAWE